MTRYLRIAAFLICVAAVANAAAATQDYSKPISRAYIELQELQLSNNPKKLQALYNELQKHKKELQNSQGTYFAEVLGIQAMLYFNANRYEEALRLLDQVLFITQQQDLALQAVVWQMQQGKIYNAMGNLDKAIASYENAVLVNEALDPQLLITHPLIKDNGQLYYELAELYLHRAEQVSGELRANFIKAAVEAIENRRASELNDYFHSQCMTRSGLLSSKITEKIDDSSAFLYPIVYKDSIKLIFGSSHSIDVITTNTDIEKVRDLSRALRDALENPRSFQFKQPASKLFTLLIAPVLTQLLDKNMQNLVIIPDIELINIPWSALFDEKNKQYLVELVPIAVLPSLRYTNLTPTKLSDASVLYAGLSVAPGDAGALIFVEDEIRSLQQITRRDKVMFNEQFTRENLLNEVNHSGFTIHHLATHASLKNDFSQSFIATYNGPLRFDDLLRSIASNQYNQDAMDMVVLNGCATASGDNRAALGLAGLTIKSGAKSVVGTLWQVNDEAAMILMAEFYKNLNKNMTKSEAMRLAQLYMLKSQDNFSHPNYWSAFLVIGNWL